MDMPKLASHTLKVIKIKAENPEEPIMFLLLYNKMKMFMVMASNLSSSLSKCLNCNIKEMNPVLMPVMAIMNK
nr:NADH dehydrogenase subunit 4L [Pomacea canaliculata]